MTKSLTTIAKSLSRLTWERPVPYAQLVSGLRDLKDCKDASKELRKEVKALMKRWDADVRLSFIAPAIVRVVDAAIKESKDARND